MPLRVVGGSIARDESALQIFNPKPGDIWESTDGDGYYVNWTFQETFPRNFPLDVYYTNIDGSRRELLNTNVPIGDGSAYVSLLEVINRDSNGKTMLLGTDLLVVVCDLWADPKDVGTRKGVVTGITVK